MAAALEHVEPQSEQVDGSDYLALSLPAYEGPLELLLDLIRKHEVDILDIPIALITAEYLKHIEEMERLDIELSAEWLEMASMLVLIKSKMLLPKIVEVVEDEDGPDPRAELVARIIEYQKYKQAAEALDERPVLERDVFNHPSKVAYFKELVGPPELKSASVTDLMSAIQRIISRSKKRGEWVLDMNSQKLTLRSVMLDVASILDSKPKVAFEELFEGFEITRDRVITTFLALLEMTKLKIVKIMQTHLEDEPTLYVERAVVDIAEFELELELDFQ